MDHRGACARGSPPDTNPACSQSAHYSTPPSLRAHKSNHTLLLNHALQYDAFVGDVQEPRTSSKKTKKKTKVKFTVKEEEEEDDDSEEDEEIEMEIEMRRPRRRRRAPLRALPQQPIVINMREELREESYCGLISWLIAIFTGCWCIACCPVDKRMVHAVSRGRQYRKEQYSDTAIYDRGILHAVSRGLPPPKGQASPDPNPWPLFLLVGLGSVLLLLSTY